MATKVIWQTEYGYHKYRVVKVDCDIFDTVADCTPDYFLEQNLGQKDATGDDIGWLPVELPDVPAIRVVLAALEGI